MTTHLIIGGPGRTGSRVIERLRARGEAPLAASRRSGFDWHDQSTWGPFLAQARTAYVTYAPDLAFPGVPELLLELGARGRAAGIERFVLLSGRGEEGARRAEAALIASGVPTTVLRCSWFQQNFSEHFLRGPVLRGSLKLPAGDVAEAFVDVEDVADAAVSALVSADPRDGVFELSGPELLTFDAVARILSRSADRAVEFQPVSVADFVSDVGRDGIERDEAEPLALLFTEILDGRNSSLTDGIRRLLDREPACFASYAQRTAATGVWS